MSIKLKRIAYPAMVLLTIMPIFASASQFASVNANASRRRPRVVRRYHRMPRRNKRAMKRDNWMKIVYAAYQVPRRGQKGPGRYVVKTVRFNLNRIPKNKRQNFINWWSANLKHTNQVKAQVNRKNRQLAKSRRLPKDAPYIVANHNAMMLGSESSKKVANQPTHMILVPIKIKSNTTLWDIARANLKHYNRRTYNRVTNNFAKALLKLNPKLKGVHRNLKRGTVLMVPTKARSLKTKFSLWAEFTAGLSKRAINDKRKIYTNESHGNYHVWQGYRHLGNSRRGHMGIPFGKYQLDARYLHEDNGHAWNSPYAQEDLANVYADRTYGNWINAWRFHRSHGWY